MHSTNRSTGRSTSRGLRLLAAVAVSGALLAGTASPVAAQPRNHWACEDSWWDVFNAWGRTVSANDRATAQRAYSNYMSLVDAYRSGGCGDPGLPNPDPDLRP